MGTSAQIADDHYSAWMGIIVHSAQSVFLLIFVLTPSRLDVIPERASASREEQAQTPSRLLDDRIPIPVTKELASARRLAMSSAADGGRTAVRANDRLRKGASGCKSELACA
jgi:hypothetical protein